MATAAAAGCSSLGEFSSIYHNRNVQGADGGSTPVSAITVDAKQRTTYVSAPPSDGVTTTTTTTTTQSSPEQSTTTTTHTVKSAPPSPAGSPAAGPPSSTTVDEVTTRNEPSQTVKTVTEKKETEFSWPRVCAEPAPDVFSAYSASATGDTNIGFFVKPTADSKVDVAAKGAAAFGETAAAIERTQAINLIRESMYRTCERYLSGAINGDELMIQAARDHRAMLAFLAIEQLTAPLRPAPVVIGGPGLDAGLGGVDAAKALNDAIDEQAKDEASQATAQSDFDAAKKVLGDKTCPAPAGAKLDDGTDQAAACKTLNDKETALGKAKSATAAAQNKVKQWTLVATAASGGGGASVSATAAAVLAQSPSQGQQNNIDTVARTVKDIFTEANQFDELMMVCVVKVRDGFDNEAMQHMCEAYFSKEAAENRAEELKIRGMVAEAVSVAADKSQTFKSRLETLDRPKISSALKSYISAQGGSYFTLSKPMDFMNSEEFNIYPDQVNEANAVSVAVAIYQTQIPGTPAAEQFSSNLLKAAS